MGDSLPGPILYLMTKAPEISVSGFNEEAEKFVLFAAHEHDVKFIRLWFTDILGTLKGFAITVDELEEVLRNGASFDGASIAGLVRSEETDMVAVPDPSTWQQLPWRPTEKGVARMFCDLENPDGAPAPVDCRGVLRKNISRALDLGFTFYLAPEIEFYYLDRDTLQPIDESGYFDQTSTDGAGSDLRRETVLALEDVGIPVKHSHHEVSGGQHEIDIRHMNALAMGDAVVTYRFVVKEIAAQRGVHATFMPRPFNDRHGSGMHTSMSLFKGDENAFYDADDELKLSETGRRFIAGLLRHSGEITAITNQWVNSYKRLVRGLEAPIYSSWSLGQWGDLIRVPAYRTGREHGLRVEYRAPDAACNPYLAFSVMLAAGLAGIERGYPLPQPIKGNVYDLSDSERSEYGIDRLPSTLDEALRVTEQSELVRDALGDNVIDRFLQNKRIEWERYSQAVTDFEINEYLFRL